MGSTDLLPALAYPTVHDASQMVLKIRDIPDTQALTELVIKIIHLVGGEVFVFHTRFQGARGAASHRYLVGCPPALCQEYNARKWREIDPVIAYSTHHMRPILSSGFSSLSPGQKELMKAAKSAGFAANISIPARHPGDSRLGLLYVGATAIETETRLYTGQGLLVQLSNELLDWVANRVRQQEMGGEAIQLDSLDFLILRYCYQGFTAEDVANLCEVPVSRVRHRMKRHMDKFHAKTHKAAVSCAIESGILRMHECTNDNTPSQLASH